jgi:branched-chain amino acid transport system ATP-binding protein
MILQINNLCKNFGNLAIIRGINWEILRGERHALIGPNGAGKSTLFNLITGLYEPTSGSIKLNGREIAGRKPFEIGRLGLSRSFQILNIFHNMSVFENIQCSVLWSLGYKYSFWNITQKQKDVQSRAEAILERIGMQRRRHVIASTLSYAEQRLLEIGITIAGGAEIILLDEPTAGLSKHEIDQVINLIREVTEGKTLILVEHDMEVVFAIASRISVLVYGEIIATDTPQKIKENRNVQEAYLGSEEL